MGPNQGKNYLEQTKCVARALMAYSPKAVGDPISEQHILDECQSKYRSLNNSWVRTIHSWGESYLYVGNPLEEGGRSCKKPPEGARVVAEFDFRPTENGLIERFKKAVSQLESQAKAILEKPSPNKEETDFGILFGMEVVKLTNTRDACRPEYNEEIITEFRNSIKKSPDVLPFPNNPAFFTVPFEYLTAFRDHIAEKRKIYCADGLLYGSITAVVYICAYCMTKVDQNPAAKDHFTHDPSVAYSNLALVLTSSSYTDPVQILVGTIGRAIKCGFTSELLDIVAEFRQIVDNKIELALNAETTDQSFDILYEAIPLSFVTKIILFALMNNPDPLASKMQLIKNSYEIVDEKLTRLRLAVTNQVTDFSGENWEMNKVLVAALKREKGEATAKQYVEYLVEQCLFYPRKFKSALLEDS